MQSKMAMSLEADALRVAGIMSKPDRTRNILKETYSIAYVLPLSESTAAVVYDKAPTNKQALAFFYWMNWGKDDGGWRNIFVTGEHARGMLKVEKILDEVDRRNYPFTIGIEPASVSE